MLINKNKKEKFQQSKGFTLIELLVSLALFSIVIVIILGAIISISDANKKARSLMTVMNNLNFAVDSMTRSFKTGSNPNDDKISGYEECFTTDEINYAELQDIENAPTRKVYYCWEQSDGAIYKIVGGVASKLTSPDITIEDATFHVSSGQPLLFINLKGLAQVGPNIGSEFTIQTSVNQRSFE